MSIQYACENMFLSPEFEYKAEELKKKMQCTMANFAQIRFRKAMQARLIVASDNK